MDRDAKHALFAATALHAMIVVDQAKPTKEQTTAQSMVVDAAYFADLLIREVEKS